MNKLRLLAATAALALLAGEAHALDTAGGGHAYVCSQVDPGRASGPRQITVPASPTNYTYSLNNRGCGLIDAYNLGYFLSQGFTISSDVGQQGLGPIGSGAGAQSTANYINLPPGAHITGVTVYNGGTAAADIKLNVSPYVNASTAGALTGNAKWGNIVPGISAVVNGMTSALTQGASTVVFPQAAGSNPSQVPSVSWIMQTIDFPSGTTVYVDQQTSATLGAASVYVTIQYQIQ